jgi:hypothetical protein
VGHSVVEMGMGCAAAPPKEGLRNDEQRPVFSIPRPSPKRQRNLIHLPSVEDPFPMAEDVLMKIRSTVRSPKGGTNHDPSR